MRTRRMTIEQGWRVGIDRFPNLHRSGSIRGMKRLYYGKNGAPYRMKDVLADMEAAEDMVCKLLEAVRGLTG